MLLQGKLELLKRQQNFNIAKYNYQMSGILSPQQGVLSEQNLISIYLIEDKIQSNFKKVNQFIRESNLNFGNLNVEINHIKKDQIAIKDNFSIKMMQMERKIINQISMELDGRISVAIGKSIQSFTQKMQKRQKGMGDIKQQFDKKLQKMKTDLKYEVSMQNQKFLNRQIKKINETPTKTSNQPAKNIRVESNPLNQQTKVQQNSQQWQQQHHFMKNLQSRIQSLEEFSVSVDKRVYNGITSIKESWKQLGTQLLDNKKNLNKKFDELRIQFMKLKTLKQFSVIPDKIEDEFKRKLTQKFTDIYQHLSTTMTKTQYEATTDKLNAMIKRHDDDFIQIRNELATNSQFFTFYANNSDQQNLKQQIDDINAKYNQDKYEQSEYFNQLALESVSHSNFIKNIKTTVEDIKKNFQEKSIMVDNISYSFKVINQRIQNLQDFNRFGPDKLQAIHNVLDGQLSASERQLVQAKSKKNNMLGLEQTQKQFKLEINKLKDQMFLLTSQIQLKQDEITQVRKQYKELETKFDKYKGQNEQMMASRKPWVCLSCDKQQKIKQQVKRQAKLKRPQPFKGFGPQRSQKNIKQVPPTPPYEERFEVYEKLREKYLSDTIKLPQIFKQKLKDSSFQT